MQQQSFRIIGTSPLLMHSDRYANPLDEGTKAHKVLTSKRKKTDEDHSLIMKSEWLGGLYWDDSIGVYMPSVNIRSCLIEGAKLNKLGMAIKRGTFLLSEREPLIYPKPAKKPLDLYADPSHVDVRSVVVSQSRLMRCRPIFREWQLQFEIHFDPKQADISQIITSFENAGKFIGLGDFRPAKGGLFGRFNLEVL